MCSVPFLFNESPKLPSPIINYQSYSLGGLIASNQN
jgi:hypothetical protein